MLEIRFEAHAIFGSIDLDATKKFAYDPIEGLQYETILIESPLFTLGTRVHLVRLGRRGHAHRERPKLVGQVDVIPQRRNRLGAGCRQAGMQ